MIEERSTYQNWDNLNTFPTEYVDRVSCLGFGKQKLEKSDFFSTIILTYLTFIFHSCLYSQGL